jgi:hypothetical protein
MNVKFVLFMIIVYDYCLCFMRMAVVVFDYDALKSQVRAICYNSDFSFFVPLRKRSCLNKCRDWFSSCFDRIMESV